MTYFPSAASASDAGYRPCLRCRPEAAPGTPAWLGTTTTVQRALKLILAGALDDGGMADLADRLGISSRYLGKLFNSELGVSPQSLAQTSRLQRAKRLLDETPLRLTEIAYAAGYGSVRRFNDHIRRTYGMPPSQLRRQPSHRAADGFCLQLSYRPPFDFAAVLEFIARRAIPDVEGVTDAGYWRHFSIDDKQGQVRVTQASGRDALDIAVDVSDGKVLLNVLERVRRLFDLEADPIEINRVLLADRDLAPLVASAPGQRVPGCWEPFEVAVRAVVGQQISVAGATTIMGRLAAMNPDGPGAGFPQPEVIAALDPGCLPMPMARGRALIAMAAAVAAGEVDFTMDSHTIIDQLCAIKGIGPWTAAYVAMRALQDPDAFLERDLVLERSASHFLRTHSTRELAIRAEQWRPWRAYAALHLWRHAPQAKS